MTKKAKNVVKVVVLGDGGVGKTTLVYNILGIEKEATITPGLAIESKTITLPNDEVVELVFWDLGGQPQFRFFQKDFMDSTNFFLFVFDLHRYVSFEKLEKEWLPLLEDIKTNNTNIKVLVGNKLDLGQTITDEDILNFVKQHQMEYFPVSAKKGMNVEKLMQYISTKLCNGKAPNYN